MPKTPDKPKDSLLSLTNRIRILLAEDRAETARLITAFLNRRTYEVDTVRDGESAVLAFGTGQYDVVLMDIGLPILDGCSAIERIRQWELQNGMPPTPVIALTAYVADQEIERCLAAGATLHIGKPVKRTTLIEFINWIVRRQKETTASLMSLIVEIPSERSDALNRFISERKTAAERFRELLSHGDFRAIKEIACQLKRDRGQEEPLDLVVELIRALEQAASREDAADVVSLTGLLSQYLDRLSVVCRDPGEA